MDGRVQISGTRLLITTCVCLRDLMLYDNYLVEYCVAIILLARWGLPLITQFTATYVECFGKPDTSVFHIWAFGPNLVLLSGLGKIWKKNHTQSTKFHNSVGP